MEQRQLRNLKILMLVSSLICLGFLVAAAWRENVTVAWRGYQRDYGQRLAAAADVSEAATETYPVAMKQSYLPTLGRVDRCITCHVGIDNPEAADYPQPLTAHRGSLLEHHPPDKFGCTICHQGQGRATELPDAHGQVPHWPEPLLSGPMTYTSCGRCHFENDLYGGQADLYGQMRPITEITRGELQSHVPGAENIARGKQLVIQHGCLGCHKYRGRGGTLGPDLTYVGDKTVHDFDFTHVHGSHTVRDWMFAHFKSPAAVVPTTVMPEMGLSDQQANDLADYMISLKRKSVPVQYTPLPRVVDRQPVGGATLYQLHCSSCHGAQGTGAVARAAQDSGAMDQPRELLTPSLRNNDALSVASDDYLRAIVHYGRRGTGMPSWGLDGGLAADEIDRLVDHIRSWQAAPPPSESIAARHGNPRFGRVLFRARCASCHGVQGEGGIGVSLRSASFLAVASDDFLRDTIVNGRPNTAMPGWSQLSADEISDLIAHLRSWQIQPPARQDVLARLAESPTDPQESLRIGKTLYRANCANCHGIDAGGALGPSLNRDAWLSIVDDSYLLDAIVRGHPGTAMPAWHHLSADSVAQLIRHLRRANQGARRQLPPWLARGDWDRGRIIFHGTCGGCHGMQAEGTTGPQLANPVFLDTVGDEMLREWVRYGKLGTPMLGFHKDAAGMVELTDSQIEDVITFLRYRQAQDSDVVSRPGMGIVPYGQQIFAGICAGCHGQYGQGLTGPALSNREFLRRASDGYLAATIALGRDGTQMRAMGQGMQGYVEMGEEEIENVVAFIRHWQREPPVAGVTHRHVVGADTHDGRALYQGYCIGCHGPKGRGGWAPELNNPDFLAAATDGFLQATIARGRSGTAMRAFGKGSGGLAPLTSDQIEDLVSYIRTWATAADQLQTTPAQRRGEEGVRQQRTVVELPGSVSMAAPGPGSESP